jgi:D-glycero-alpha-D-manno-heptose-7-phosphate kinase
VLIARAPVRISLAGGGTDLPVYYERHGGFVVSTTIDKYFYILVNVTGVDSIQISSSDYRVFYRQRPGESPLWDGDLGLVKAALHHYGLQRGLSLFLASEVPPGTGLGSSSAVAVALIKALAAVQGHLLAPADVATQACILELDWLCSPIGKQDQYAAAFGGLNAITFARDGVAVEPLAVSSDTRETLERNLLLFFTGATRQANAILSDQRRASADEQGDTVAALHAIKAAAHETKRVLEQGHLDMFGEILAELWEHKKRLAAGVSNARIDELYALARRHGALGGKLAGAGGGGFLLLYCDEPHQVAVTRALEGAGLYRMDYRFEQGGAQVLVNALPWPVHPWPIVRQRELSYA